MKSMTRLDMLQIDVVPHYHIYVKAHQIGRFVRFIVLIQMGYVIGNGIFPNSLGAPFRYCSLTGFTAYPERYSMLQDSDQLLNIWIAEYCVVD